MISKVMKPAQSANASVAYNEGKALSTTDVGIFFTHNINGDCREDIEAVFAQYEHNPAINVQMKRFGMHAVFSLGPEDNPDDPTTEERMHDYINEWAERMGYGDQPYAVYCHQDTGHKHFHFVSTRVDEEGKKIDDSNEKRRDLALLKELAPKYGFIPGDGTMLLKKEEQREKNRERKEQREREMVEKKRKWGYPTMERFNARKSDVLEQFRTHFEEALTYNFTSMHQFEAIMRARGILVRQAMLAGETKESLVFKGLSKHDAEVTRLYGEKEVGIDAMRLIQERMEKNRQEHKVLRREKARVENIAMKLFEWSTSQRHFERMLNKKGIDVVFSRAEDNPSHIIGATFIDHTVKTAFKASELDKSIAAAQFEKALADGKWKAEDTSKDVKDEDIITKWQDDELTNALKNAVNLLSQGGGQSMFRDSHGNHAGKTQNQLRYEMEQAEEEAAAQIYKRTH